MGVIVTKPTSSAGGGGGAYSQPEKLAIELEMEFKAAELYYYKEFGYTGSQLTAVDIYHDNTKVIQLFAKTLTYTGSVLTSTFLTRVSDSATLHKAFDYSGPQLTSITTTVSG